MKREKRRKKRYQAKDKKEVCRRWRKMKSSTSLENREYKKGEVIMTEEKM